MEDWHAYASVIGGSVGAALAVSLIVSVGIYSILRVLHSVPRFRNQHTWRTDLRPIRWISLTAFILVLLPGFFLGWLFSDLCGTGNSEEFGSPDGKHKIAVYSFDCGATTDFSLVVSLLRAGDQVPKHRTARVLYSLYHQKPTRSNVHVFWRGSAEVLVKVAGFNGAPLVTHDGVSVRFETLP